MSKFLLFIFIISFSVSAENSRSPAVLDNSCNLDIPTQVVTIVNGKEFITEKSAEEVQKEQCREIRKCMASADDEEMSELKSLEDVACSVKITAVNTRTPAIVPDKNFDGKRKAKEAIAEEIVPAGVPTSSTKAK